MGDSRIVVELTGNHGCGREAAVDEKVERCGLPGCVDCMAIEFVNKLRSGNSVSVATLSHWPDKNLDLTERRPFDFAGPVDDLISGIRTVKSFADVGKEQRAADEARIAELKAKVLVPPTVPATEE